MKLPTMAEYGYLRTIDWPKRRKVSKLASCGLGDFLAARYRGPRTRTHQPCDGCESILPREPVTAFFSTCVHQRSGYRSSSVTRRHRLPGSGTCESGAGNTSPLASSAGAELSWFEALAT